MSRTLWHRLGERMHWGASDGAAGGIVNRNGRVFTDIAHLRLGEEHTASKLKFSLLETTMKVIASDRKLNIFGLFSIAFLILTGLYLIFSAVTFDATLAALAASMAALCGIFFSLHTNTVSQEAEKSRFYLENAISALEKGIDLLELETPSRVRWINGARIIYRAAELEKYIVNEEHKKIFNLSMERTRVRILNIFDTRENPRATGAFFYGATNPSLPIDQAAAEASAPDGISLSSVKQIPEDVIRAILRFAEFPSTYEEPLPRDLFTPEEIVRLQYQANGVYQYVTHRRIYHTIGGKIIKKEDRQGANS